MENGVLFFIRTRGGKRERHGVREMYSLKKRKGICLAKGEGIEREERGGGGGGEG